MKNWQGKKQNKQKFDDAVCVADSDYFIHE